MERRKFIKILGGGVVVAAAASVGTFLSTRTPTAALQPWEQAGNDYRETIKFALSYAILAPNPHNRQAWLVDIHSSDEITLYADLDRLLPNTDPFSRQITIGYGCFLELLDLAAQQRGFKTEVTMFPNGSNTKQLTTDPIAHVRFVPTTKPADPLFNWAMQRRSNKQAFDMSKPVSAEAITTLKNITTHGTAIDATNNPQEVEALRVLTNQALIVETETPRTHKESVDLMRIGKKEIEANPDGIHLGGPFLESLALLGQLDRKQMLDPTSSAYAQGLSFALQGPDTAMGHVWLVSPGNSRVDQINAGRDWLRLNLTTTQLGLGLHPLSQALQEYQEMASLYQDVHSRLAPNGGTVQMLGRIGYGKVIPRSPRWPLESKIIRS